MHNVFSIIFLSIIFIGVILIILWYHYKCSDELDKIIRSPQKQIWGLIGIMTIILIIFIIIQNLLSEKEPTGNAFFLIYGLFSQTLEAYNIDTNTTMQIFYLIISAIGAIFFSGVLISTITNGFMRRIEDLNNGKVRYKSLYNHDVIIGSNEILLSVIKFLSYNNTSNKIVIVSNNKIDKLTNTIESLDTKIRNRIILYKDNILNKSFLASIEFVKCNRIVIIGDKPLNLCDSDNITILSILHKYAIDNPKRDKALDCFVSYKDDYMLLNYCRNAEAGKIHIIAFNYYSLWADRVFGYGQLYNNMHNVLHNKKSKKLSNIFDYSPIIPIKEGEYCAHIVILGFNNVAAEIVKSLIKNAHFDCFDEKNRKGRTIISVISNNTVEIARFKIRYHYEYIQDIELRFIEINNKSTDCLKIIDGYASEYKEKLYIVIADLNIEHNILIANNLPLSVKRMELPVLVYYNHFNQYVYPLNNIGNKIKHIQLMGFTNSFINLSGALNEAKALRYVHILKKDFGHDKASDFVFDDKTNAKIDEVWFGNETSKGQIDNPRQLILSTINSLMNLIDSLGLELCTLDESEEMDEQFINRFCQILHRQEIAWHIMAGYYPGDKDDEYEFKIVSTLIPLSKISDKEKIKLQTERLRGKCREILIWLELNSLGLRRKNYEL